MGDMVPRQTIAKDAGKAIGGIGGGAALMLLNGLGGIPGIVVGSVITLAGLGISSSKEDRIAGLITTAAGALTIIGALPFVGGIASTLMTIGGLGLLGGGIYSAYRFFKGMKSRS
ncbi:MAG: hypothetical protein ACLFR1_03200 [Spirochaetia bacterium]